MSEAALRWLEVVLLERFGSSFTLAPDRSGCLRLDMAGASGAILFAGDQPALYDGAARLSCASWDAAAEGWQAPLGGPVPAPGADKLPEPLVEWKEDGCRVHYDIPGLVYRMMTRLEEVDCAERDGHDRFPATASEAFRNGYLSRPIADEWLDVLGQIIQRVWPAAQLKQNRFRMVLSHDVDAPSRYAFASPAQLVRRLGADVVRRGDIGSVVLAMRIRASTRQRLDARDPENTFDWIMDVSERSGLKSAFYFICGRTAPEMDADYEIEHPAMRELLRRVHARGHEIGLHPSYHTYLSPQALTEEAERLKRVCREEGIEQEVWGGRMHNLRWRHPQTLYGWEAAGLAYDSTMSFADHAGFRCGTCHEYPAFDPVAQKMLHLRLRPLVAMDVTIMAERYMNLGTSEAAFETLAGLKHACRAVGGNFSLLWHNTQFDTAAKRSLYEQVLSA